MSNTRHPYTIKLLTQSLRAILVALTIGFVGCNYTTDLVNSSSTTTTTPTELNSNLPKVVATTSVLCDLTKQVAAQTINLTCLTSPDTALYLYQPKPEDSTAIEQAKVIFYNGYGFEPSLLRLIRTSKSPAAKIAVAQRAVPNPLQYRRNGKIVSNPYVWHNPKNGIRMVEIISSNLSKIIPENASLYNSNAQRIKKELNQLDVWMKLRIASIPSNNRKLVTTNDAMAYYVTAYDLTSPNALKNINSETKPTSARVKVLVRNLRRARVPTIFVNTQVNPDLINTVAKTAKVKVSERQLLVDNLGTSGNEGDTYQKMLTANTRTIVEGLGGTYLIFEPQAFTNQQ
ncbi:MAG: zinc ABC transporter substrate-binding protein [Fischerella sp.]|jgi:manganese/iron transport system substrate-binding protein|uniref:metal ABC transporter solute-binding protein, Zn/Mn family n=1 Tax=Fischerella sp. TaxID=1191 RepID=UPI00179F194C|nr:zinc ABC transporter substrate-binding protein [Fischerella sp.]NWF61428.1 zinc ABC transporter substrate-binding protein [Fischerella sp.]